MAKGSVLTPQAEDFPRWYQDVVAKAELADNGPVRGTMVIRPYGYACGSGCRPRWTPASRRPAPRTPTSRCSSRESYLQREAEHVEGFSPELAVVTHAGGKELEEPVVVRPTSETIINEYFAKWMQSYRDLPLLHQPVGQRGALGAAAPRCSCARPSSSGRRATPPTPPRTTPATTPCGSCATCTPTSWSNVLAMPVLRRPQDGARSGSPGAINTLTCEAMMGDGKALQMGTSHELGPELRQGVRHPVPRPSRRAASTCWQTSWGVSTRMVGGLIMCHGDDAGLRVPAAPRADPGRRAAHPRRGRRGARPPSGSPRELTAAGRARRARRPDRHLVRAPGRRLGAQGRARCASRSGPRDLAEGEVTVVRRRHAAPRTPVPVVDGGRRACRPLLEDIQAELLAAATGGAATTRTADVETVDEAVEAAADGLRPAAVGGARHRGRGPDAGRARRHGALPAPP